MIKISGVFSFVLHGCLIEVFGKIIGLSRAWDGVWVESPAENCYWKSSSL